jgi:hypothetical protein
MCQPICADPGRVWREPTVDLSQQRRPGDLVFVVGKGVGRAIAWPVSAQDKASELGGQLTGPLADSPRRA